MGLFLKERRGPAWKQGWAKQALDSVSPPPLQLLAILAIIFLLIFLSSYPTYKYQIEQTTTNLKVFLLFLPVLLIFVAVAISSCERLVFNYYGRTKRDYLAGGSGGDIPWGVVVLVVLLLVLVSKQSYFHSMWYPSIWRSG